MKPYRLWSLICEAVYQLRYQLRWKQSMARNPDALSGLDLRRQRDQELMRRVDQQARAVAAQAETELCASIMANLHIVGEAELRECITQLISGAQGREVVLLGQDPESHPQSITRHNYIGVERARTATKSPMM